MKTKKLPVLILMIACVLLSACASKANPPSAATSTPMGDKNTPITAPTIEPTTATVTPFEGLSSGLDNSTQARIRTVSEVMGAPKTDVYVNGLPAFNGGFAQQNIDAGQFSGWLYITPGTYTVALVPHGETLDQALFSPANVKVEAGHRYTIAAIGQLADKDIHALDVDETALIADVNPGPTESLSIDINNLKGADSITEECDGKTVAENIQYGEVRAYVCPSGTPLFKTVANGKTPGVLWDAPDRSEPRTSFALPWFGPYPADNYDSVGIISQGTSELNVLDFLAGFNGRNVNMDGHSATFTILLAAIEKAGLHDQFVNSDPYMFIAPTDEAFDTLPTGQKDALLNDPQALTQLLNAHIVDGYFPWGSLSGANAYGNANRTVTNRLGQELKFAGDFINGIPDGPNYTVGNGYRVQIIYHLLPVK